MSLFFAAAGLAVGRLIGCLLRVETEYRRVVRGGSIMLLTTAAPVASRQTRAFIDREHRLLIDGQWVAAASGQTIPVKNPATGETIAHVAAGDKADIDRAVSAARQAFESGRSKSPLYRASDIESAPAITAKYARGSAATNHCNPHVPVPPRDR